MIEAELSKRYGACVSLAGATFAVRPGTVHALVGENGAGKSTLVKIVAGVLRADSGKLAVAGKQVELARWDRGAARAAGIGIVHQHGASAGALSVVENAVLGLEPRRAIRVGGRAIRLPVLDLEETSARLAELGARIGLPVEPHAIVDALSLGAAQRSEIVAALHYGAKLLILDEPTAVLTPVEVDGLLGTLRTLAAEGRTIVIVTHKLDEVRAVADEVTVLRAGKTVATFAASGDGPARRTSIPGAAAPPTGEAGRVPPRSIPGAAAPPTGEAGRVPPRSLDVGAIAKAMVGAELPAPVQLPAPPEDAKEALGLDHLGRGALGSVSLAVRCGELVGVAGVDGNGQRELALEIAGLSRTGGGVRIAGRHVEHASPAHRLAAGLAHIPEDRHHGGLLLDSTVADNLALGRVDITGRWRIDRAAVRRNAEARIAELDIRPADPDAVVRSLSGGNQQKVVVARELSRPGLNVVIAAQPTRGVDLGAVARIHDRLRAAASAGAGVLVISADLDELLALCHRIVVLLRGRIVGELGGAALREGDARATLGTMMTGAAA